MQAKYVKINGLKVIDKLYHFINDELIKGTKINQEKFWLGFDKIVHELAPKNRKLIEFREDLQRKIDEWHIKNKGNEIKIDEYKKFLKQNLQPHMMPRRISFAKIPIGHRFKKQ